MDARSTALAPNRALVLRRFVLQISTEPLSVYSTQFRHNANGCDNGLDFRWRYWPTQRCLVSIRGDGFLVRPLIFWRPSLLSRRFLKIAY